MGAKKPKKDKTEQKRQKAIMAGNRRIDENFKGFDDNFYNQRATDYNAYAMPEVDNQYAKAQKELEFALARQYGTTQTSTAAEKQAELAKAYGDAKVGVADTGVGLATKARADVANSKSTLQNQLAATADPSAAANSAMNQVEILTQKDPYTPLGQLFANVTEGLAASQYPYGITGGPTTPYGTGAGATSRKASTIVQ